MPNIKEILIIILKKGNTFTKLIFLKTCIICKCRLSLILCIDRCIYASPIDKLINGSFGLTEYARE